MHHRQIFRRGLIAAAVVVGIVAVLLPRLYPVIQAAQDPVVPRAPRVSASTGNIDEDNWMSGGVTSSVDSQQSQLVSLVPVDAYLKYLPELLQRRVAEPVRVRRVRAGAPGSRPCSSELKGAQSLAVEPVPLRLAGLLGMGDGCVACRSAG